MDTEIVYLAKDNADLVCHCACQFGLIAYPTPLDCPWCGCGWRFTCLECRQPFTFAVGVELNDTWESLARQDLLNRGVTDPPARHVGKHAEELEELLAGVEVGRRYVYLDGIVVPADAGAIHRTGWYARHDLDYVPHVKALDDRSTVADVLANPRYWDERVVPAEE